MTLSSGLMTLVVVFDLVTVLAEIFPGVFGSVTVFDLTGVDLVPVSDPFFRRVVVLVWILIVPLCLATDISVPSYKVIIVLRLL